MIIVGALVLVAVVAVAIFSLAGGDAIELPDLTGEETPETPEFAFERSRPTAVETAAEPQHQAATEAARGPAEATTEQLDGLYTAAFLEPGNWMDGDYDDVLTFFAGDAYDQRWGPFTMGALIGAIPVIVLFQFLQRFLVSGMTAGAVKG